MQSPSVTCFAAVIAVVAAVCGGWMARGSTAVPAAVWSAVASGAFLLEMLSRASGGLVEPSAAASVRLVVVALSLCPMMSLLGAKRPQHGVWQFIVASLAVVLAMPAASAMLIRPGSMPDVHFLQRWFMPVLVAVGLMNFIGTRHGAAAVAIAAGQAILLRGFLPFAWGTEGAGAGADATAAWLVAGGAVVAIGQSCLWPAGRCAQGSPAAAAITPPFLALRETLGAAWTLRIAERFNVVAEARGWPCRLRFDGLHAGGDPHDHAWHGDAIRTATALLRRFASPGWLRRHRGEERT